MMRHTPFVTLCLLGCAAPKPPAEPIAPPRSMASSSPAREPTDAELTANGLVIRVDETGAMPRKALVMRVAPHADTFRVEAESTLVTHSRVGGKPFALHDKPVTVRAHLDIRTQPTAARVDCSLRRAGVEDAFSSCHFVRREDGALTKAELLTGDQTTGDDDDAGDGLTQHGAWPVIARMALRLVSAALPHEAIGVGARWQTWERVRIDHAWTRRHARYELLGWTAHGMRLRAIVDETAAPQTYTTLDEVSEEAERLLQAAPQAIGPMQVTLSPETLEAARQAFPVITLHRAQLHAEGELDVALDRALPESATFKTRAICDVESRHLRESGDITRTIRIARSP